MSCHQNEILLEQLYEKYLKMGYSEIESEEKAISEFNNMSI
jgi:hypothetical protein|tara:strand:- start:500 stop:622 length:123 start_codon:yes stop_codon:yes gene_type:complete